MTGPNLYAGSAIDRAAHRRRDKDWIEAQFLREDSRILPVWRNESLIHLAEPPAAGLVSHKTVLARMEKETVAAFLGLFEAVPYFAVDVSHLDDPAGFAAAADARFADLRELGPLLGHAEAGLLAYARGLVYWHRRHGYCGACGSRTESAEAGHMRRCLDGTCGAEHFPRTDPAVITLVTKGDTCLLGRQASWPKGMYLTLAGFVEPGESLEDAVAREVLEETGVQVFRIRYVSSQPWPFPASLMIGFRAEAEEGSAIAPRIDELEDVQWFTRAELKDRKRINVRLPYRGAIARGMIEGWIKEV